MAFEPLVKGTPNWHEKYNTDLASIDSQLENKANLQSPNLTGSPTVNGASIATKNL